MKFIGEYDMTDAGRGPQQPRLQPRVDIAAPKAPGCVVTFALTGGIFGVGRLAAQLNKLVESGQIGVWHIGPWIDWHHNAIRIKFDSVADRKLAEEAVRLAVEAG